MQAIQPIDLSILPPQKKPERFNFKIYNLTGLDMNMILHDDGHTNVINFDGLFEIDYIAKNCNGKKGNSDFAKNSFDFIVTNPPFGSIVKNAKINQVLVL